MLNALPVIYLVAEPDYHFPEDTRATALCQDGTELASYVYLESEKARRRLENAHGLYRRHYPNGYRLVWAKTDPGGYAAALALREAKWQASRSDREAEQARRRDALRESREITAPESPLNVEPELQALRRMAETAWSEDDPDEEE